MRFPYNRRLEAAGDGGELTSEIGDSPIGPDSRTPGVLITSVISEDLSKMQLMIANCLQILNMVILHVIVMFNAITLYKSNTRICLAFKWIGRS